MSRSVTLVRICLFFVIALAYWPAARAETCSAPPEVAVDTRLTPNADAYTNLGNWYADHHQFDCAIDAFRSARKLEPGSAHIRYLLGLSLYMAGRPAEAAEPLQESVNADPTVLKPHLILASVLAEQGKVQAAEAQWEAALKLDPSSVMARDGLCKSLLAQGQSEPVINLLSGSRPDETLTLDLVEALELESRLQAAADILTRALKLYPSSHALVYAMVTVQVKLQHPEEGARIAENFMKAHPGDFAAQKLYLNTLEFNADPSVARPIAYKLLASAPHDAELLYLTGIDDCLAGDYPKARTHLEGALAADPNRYSDSYNLRYYLGTALFELNDYHGAIEQIQKALASQPADHSDRKPQARFELAMALRNLGETQQARDQMKLFEQEKQASENRTLAQQKAFTGNQDMARGEPQKAAEHYREALEVTPDDANMQYKLALALDSAGDLPSERAALEHAIAIDPTFALAQYQLGYVESQQGDLPSAELQFRHAVEAAPGYTKAWISLAATLGMESRFPDAQQAVTHALQLAPRDPEALELRSQLAKAEGRP
jgi:tetratricopeptide (TPR) repeat protein